MTAVNYPDREADSESGRFTIEARSPYNGTISLRDGRMPSEGDFAFKYRQHQSEFRYRLLDNAPRYAHGWVSKAADSKVVWERFQKKQEDSPQELLVSDDGWSVIRTHGFTPEVIAVRLDGLDVLRVRLTRNDGENDGGDQSRRSARPVWPLARLLFTTAGQYWSANSWRGFFRYQDETYFAWRACWGQRLVLDLEHAVAFTDEQLLPEELAVAVIEAERTGVKAFLGGLSRQMDKVCAILGQRMENGGDGRNPLLGSVRQASSALHLVGVHRLRDCVPFLREWEGVDFPSAAMGSSAMRGRWWLQTQHFRPIVHHSLKLLGEEPRGFPTYGFIAGEFASPARFAVPEHLPDRRGPAGSLSRKMSAADVLRLLGSPDFSRRRSRKVGLLYRWSEDWEYDFRDGTNWTTLRMTWKEKLWKSRMTAIQDIAPYWLDSDEREAEFLRL